MCRKTEVVVSGSSSVSQLCAEIEVDAWLVDAAAGAVVQMFPIEVVGEVLDASDEHQVLTSWSVTPQIQIVMPGIVCSNTLAATRSWLSTILASNSTALIPELDLWPWHVAHELIYF